MRSPGLAQEALAVSSAARVNRRRVLSGIHIRTNWGWIVMAVSGLPRQFGWPTRTRRRQMAGYDGG